MGASSKPRNRLGISHQEINEHHTKQIQFPLDRTYKLTVLTFPYVLETFLPSPFTDVSNVFTIIHIDLSCRAGWSGSGWNCFQPLTDTFSLFSTTSIWFSSQAKPSQSSNGWRLALSASRLPPCLLAIPAFYRIAGLYNRHLNSNWGTCLR